MADEKKVTAGAFDIRNLIGGLMGFYGLVLLVMGIWFTDRTEKAKVNGENLNLQVGIGLLVFAVLMIGWALLRPLKVPVQEGTVEDAPAAPHH
jgi:glucose uptake protein GlcU